MTSPVGPTRKGAESSAKTVGHNNFAFSLFAIYDDLQIRPCQRANELGEVGRKIGTQLARPFLTALARLQLLLEISGNIELKYFLNRACFKPVGC